MPRTPRDQRQPVEPEIAEQGHRSAEMQHDEERQEIGRALVERPVQHPPATPPACPRLLTGNSSVAPWRMGHQDRLNSRSRSANPIGGSVRLVTRRAGIEMDQGTPPGSLAQPRARVRVAVKPHGAERQGDCPKQRDAASIH